MKNERENALDKKFHALSNPTRREILMRLSQKPHSAGEIAGYFQITPASISYHLSLLQRSGLICCRQVEKRRIYSINRGSLDEVYLLSQISDCKLFEQKLGGGGKLGNL